MIGFWDVVARSESGPLVKEKEFDLKLGRIARQMVEKYDIRYDPQQVIPADDELADRVFKASLDLFLQLRFAGLVLPANGLGVLCALLSLLAGLPQLPGGFRGLFLQLLDPLREAGLLLRDLAFEADAAARLLPVGVTHPRLALFEGGPPPVGLEQIEGLDEIAEPLVSACLPDLPRERPQLPLLHVEDAVRLR